MDRSLIAVLSAGNFLVGVAAFLVVGALEPLATGLGVTAAEAGTLLTAYAVGYVILSPVLVSVTGRIGRRRILAAAVAILGVSAAASALAPTFGALFLTRLGTAAGAGLFTPVAAAVAGALAPPEARAKTLAGVFFGLTLAQVVGVPAGAWLAYAFGWRVAFWLVAALSVPVLWLLWTRVPAGLTFQPVALRDLGRMLRDWRAMLAILFTGTFLSGVYVVYTYLPRLLSEGMGWERDAITLAFACFGAAAVVGNVAGGWVSDRIGPARLLTVLCVRRRCCCRASRCCPCRGQPCWRWCSAGASWGGASSPRSRSA
ncbi:MAG: MFS transporter [Shimia sp.]